MHLNSSHVFSSLSFHTRTLGSDFLRRLFGGRDFQILGGAVLKLQAPNDVRTNEAERRLVLESEGMSAMTMTGMQG